MSLPKPFLDEIRARIAVSDVVRRRVALTKKGREWLGLSPFNKEKTPSFTVNDDKQFYHCFSSGEHGDVFTFLMRTEGLSFQEAVERLAAEAGLDMPRRTAEDRAREVRAKTLHELTDAASRWFEAQLRAPVGRAGYDYLVGRGLDDEALRRFRLGYAPPESGALIKAMTAAGFDEAQMIEVGLARRPDDGRAPYSFFRNRVMFPVTDRRGRVVGFGGRILGGDGPKYINSPDSDLFHKGRLLYNLPGAVDAARNGAPVLVVEGYMDVIALVRAGFGAAVAPLGTAVTEAQIQEAWRLAPVPVLCFDGDAAGKRAAWRALDRAMPLLKPDHSLRFAYLPAGEDPDSLVTAAGPGAMQGLLDSAQSMMDTLWERELDRHATDVPEGRAGLESGLMALVEQIGDNGVRWQYRHAVRDRVKSAFVRRAPMPRGKGRPPTGANPAGPRPQRPHRDLQAGRAAQGLVACILGHPEIFPAIAERLAILVVGDKAIDNLKSNIFATLADDPGLDSASLRDHLTEIGHGDGVARLRDERLLQAIPFARETVPSDQALAGWEGIWRSLDARFIEQDVEEARSALATTTESGDMSRIWERLRRLKEGQDAVRRFDEGMD